VGESRDCGLFHAAGCPAGPSARERLAQDTAYSLAWGAFALVLLLLSFGRKSSALRYAGLILMALTQIKLFYHDLWWLGGLYRVAALTGLAAALIALAVKYQRFLSLRRAAGPDVPAAD